MCVHAAVVFLMKIAVTYEDGNVFAHFGRTEQFKIYDITGGKVADAQVVGTDGFLMPRHKSKLNTTALNVA